MNKKKTLLLLPLVLLMSSCGDYFERHTPLEYCYYEVASNYDEYYKNPDLMVFSYKEIVSKDYKRELEKKVEYDIDKLSESEHHKAYGITIYTDTKMIPWYCEIKSRVGFGKPLKLKDIVLYGERLNG